MRDYHSYFEPNHFYHIYNRAIGEEKLFKEDENYKFFLKKWDQYLGKYLEVWAYCLMPNHFHFLIRVKRNVKLSKEDLTGFQNLSGLVSQKFSNFFNSYTKSFNKVNSRHGSLFQRPFKRVKVDSQQYLQHLIHYIHHNPIHHNLTQSYTDWKFSSYSAILSQHTTDIPRQKVLDLFNGRKSFTSHHQEMKNYNKINHIIID
jgi:REP element-mobilizing transposase RayT